MPSLNVHLLPALVGADELAGRVCVVIDVLRATTTMICALAAGAREVLVTAEVDEARRLRDTLGVANALLGGERKGIPIEGFDLGNSPEEYVPARVEGMTIVFTTTNGTRALLHCRQAREVAIAGFVNLSAAVDFLSNQDEASLVCAGTDGFVTGEDALLAGGIVERLLARRSWRLNDEGVLVRDAWRGGETRGAIGENSAIALRRRLSESRGGQNLLALGLGEDINAAAALDRFALVPRFDAATRRVFLPWTAAA